jgi:hypothetical protein
MYVLVSGEADFRRGIPSDRGCPFSTMLKLMNYVQLFNHLLPIVLNIKVKSVILSYI